MEGNTEGRGNDKAQSNGITVVEEMTKEREIEGKSGEGRERGERKERMRMKKNLLYDLCVCTFMICVCVHL